MAVEKSVYDDVGSTFGIDDVGKDTSSAVHDEGGGDGGAQPDTQQSAQDGEEDSGAQPAAQARHGEDAGAQDKPLFDAKPKRGPNGELLGKDGKVLAATPRERELAYSLNRTQHAAKLANERADALAGRLKQYDHIKALADQHKMPMSAMMEAVQLRANFEANPVEAARNIIARVLQAGYTMEQLLGPEAVPGINAQIITNVLDQRLKPLEERFKSSDQADAISQAARKELNAFVEQHPYADVHGKEIAFLVEQHKDAGMTPVKAYYEFRDWCKDRGLDFTQPMLPQLQERQRQHRAQQQPTQQAAHSVPTPGSTRSGVPAANAQQVQQRTSELGGDFSPSEPWKNIATSVWRSMQNGR